MSNLSATSKFKNKTKHVKGQPCSSHNKAVQQVVAEEENEQSESIQPSAAKEITIKETDAHSEKEQGDKGQASFGAMLQQARLNQQLSLDDASAELFILPRHLQALEEEQFDDLPQAAFARGFAINYAKFLGLDSVQVASLFDAAYPKTRHHSVDNVVTPLRTMGTGSPSLNNRVRLNPLLIIAVAALIILIIFLARLVSNARQEPEAARPLVEDLTTQAQEQGAAINSDANGLIASGSIVDTMVGSTALEIILTDTTTVNIYDATGNRLITGSQSRGNYKLTGTPPFKVDIGNVDNVSLLLNQEPVSLMDYATNTEVGAKKQARFELTL